MTLGPPDQRRKPSATGSRVPAADPPTVEDWLAARLADVAGDLGGDGSGGDDSDTEPAPGVELDEADSATVHDDLAIEDRPGRSGTGVGRVVARRDPPEQVLEEPTPDPTTVEHEHPTDPTTALVGLQLDADDDTVGPDDELPGGVGTGAVPSFHPWDELAIAPRPPRARGEETGLLLQDTDPGPGEEHVPTDFHGMPAPAGGLPPLPELPDPHELGDEPGTQWESRPERGERLARAATPAPPPRAAPPAARRGVTPAPPARRPEAPPPEMLELAPPPPGGEPEEAALGLQAGVSYEDDDSPTVVIAPKGPPAPAPEPPARPPTPTPVAATPAPAKPPEPRPPAESGAGAIPWMISASVVMVGLLGLLLLGFVALGLLSP